MDSYQHLEKGVKYPATLVTSGFNDSRIIAWQPAKFEAKMQADTASSNPVLFLTDFEGGHGANTKSKMVNEFANIFSFCLWQSGHPEFQPLESVKH